MDNSIWFLDLAEDVRLLVFLEFSRRICWMLSTGKHFGFNMLSSSVEHALLILIFSRFLPLLHDHAVVVMPCGDGATYMVCHSLRKHRSEFAQNNWFLCCEYFYFGSYLLRFTFEMVLYFISKALSPSFKPFWFQVNLPLWYLSWFRVYYNIHKFTELYFICCLSLMEHSLRLQMKVKLSADRNYGQVLVILKRGPRTTNFAKSLYILYLGPRDTCCIGSILCFLTHSEFRPHVRVRGVLCFIFRLWLNRDIDNTERSSRRVSKVLVDNRLDLALLVVLIILCPNLKTLPALLSSTIHHHMCVTATLL